MHTFDDAWYDRIGEGLDQNALVAVLPYGLAFTKSRIIESVHEPVTGVQSTLCFLAS
jgi:hypothetical protein